MYWYLGGTTRSKWFDKTRHNSYAHGSVLETKGRRKASKQNRETLLQQRTLEKRKRRSTSKYEGQGKKEETKGNKRKAAGRRYSFSMETLARGRYTLRDAIDLGYRQTKHVPAIQQLLYRTTCACVLMSPKNRRRIGSDVSRIKNHTCT